MQQNETISTRELTAKEIAKMRKKHWAIIPVVLVCSLLIYVCWKFEGFPEMLRWAGAGIAAMAILIFSSKLVKLENELRGAEVSVISGSILMKRKRGTGMKKRGSSGIGKSARKRHKSPPTYWINFTQNSYEVPKKLYDRVAVGDVVKLDYFQRSKYVLGMEVVEKAVDGEV